MATCVSFTRFQTLIYYFASFIGLAPFSIKDNNLHPVGFLLKTYTVILVVLSSLSTFYVLIHKPTEMHVTSVNGLVLTISITLLLITMCTTLLIFAFKSDTIICITNQMIAIKDQLKNVGMKDDFGKNWKSFYAKVIATNSAVLLVEVISDRNYFTKVYSLPWIMGVIISVHNHNAVLIFVEIIKWISQLFEYLNKKLKHSSGFRVDRNVQNADQPERRVNIETDNIQLSAEDVEKIGKLHGELWDLMEVLTDFYAVPILLTIAQHFGILLSNCYFIYTRVFMFHQDFETAVFDPFVTDLLVRTPIKMLELFLIANACNSIRRVGNATKGILHQVWNEFYPEDLRDEICKFSLQLLRKRVTVSAFGFFDLDYSFIHQIFCAMVAYLVVMIQFKTSPATPGAQNTR